MGKHKSKRRFTVHKDEGLIFGKLRLQKENVRLSGASYKCVKFQVIKILEEMYGKWLETEDYQERIASTGLTLNLLAPEFGI